MRREIFSEEHELFRIQFRRFVAAEVEPNVVAWNRAAITPRAIWKRMGEEGYLCADQPAQ
jgi:alkylation response protein AidB-like acyl-CoA dehydrogenase